MVEFRVLADDELDRAAWVVHQAMLGSLAPEHLDAWVQRARSGSVHGAFVPGASGRAELVGTARWFPTVLATPGGSLPVAAVSGVGVLATHRRSGLLRGLLAGLHEEVAAAGIPVAVLVAAEWPIYGRFGYGPAAWASAWELDTRSATLVPDPVGRTELIDGPERRAELDAVAAAAFAHRPGMIRRDALVWDHVAGTRAEPGEQAGQARRALWYDPDGRPGGFVHYRIEERWAAHRPAGTATVEVLLAASDTAERELWRHLSELDWVTTVHVGQAPVDVAVPLALHDARAARCTGVADQMWLRVMDVPGAFAGRTATRPGAVVLEVVAPGDPAAGRWHLQLGPNEGGAQPTTMPAELRCGAGALGAAFLGGTSLTRLAAAGMVEELVPGALARAADLFGSDRAPFNPTDF